MNIEVVQSILISINQQLKRITFKLVPSYLMLVNVKEEEVPPRNMQS